MSRELFEQHIRENYAICLEYGHLSLEMDGDGSYVHGETNGYWMIWQAAPAGIEQQRDELVVELKKAISLRVTLYRHSDMEGDTDNLTDDEIAQRDVFARQWTQAIAKGDKT
jgi:hypothetical protein